MPVIDLQSASSRVSSIVRVEKMYRRMVTINYCFLGKLENSDHPNIIAILWEGRKRAQRKS